MDRIDTEVSGGCQCGAVRFHASAMLDNSHICHCRMCQKAVGNFFAALVAAPKEAVTWTRGTPAVFLSSAEVERGFCARCGTPLFYNGVTSPHINFCTGALDEPQRFPPKRQVGMEGLMPWFDTLAGLPDTGTTEAEMPEEAASIAATNHQHPDHDTANWPQGDA